MTFFVSTLVYATTSIIASCFKKKYFEKLHSYILAVQTLQEKTDIA